MTWTTSTCKPYATDVDRSARANIVGLAEARDDRFFLAPRAMRREPCGNFVRRLVWNADSSYRRGRRELQRRRAPIREIYQKSSKTWQPATTIDQLGGAILEDEGVKSAVFTSTTHQPPQPLERSSNWTSIIPEASRMLDVVQHSLKGCSRGGHGTEDWTTKLASEVENARGDQRR